MSRTRILLIGFGALVLGALVSRTVYCISESRIAVPVGSGVDVVVATNDLQVGRRFVDKDIELVKFQTNAVPLHCFHDKSMVVGRAVVLPMAKGDPVLPSNLGGYGDPIELMSASMRAVSVRVSGVVGGVGFARRGARVDVLVGSPRRRGKEQTTTLLKNVSIIGVGQNWAHDSYGDTRIVPVVTLLLLPDDAAKLARLGGRIQLSLHNELDKK